MLPAIWFLYTVLKLSELILPLKQLKIILNDTATQDVAFILWVCLRAKTNFESLALSCRAQRESQEAVCQMKIKSWTYEWMGFSVQVWTGIYAFCITLLPTLPTNHGHSVKCEWMKLTLPAGYFLTYKKKGKMSILYAKKWKVFNFIHSSFFLINKGVFALILGV